MVNMALIKSNAFFTSLMILVALFGVSFGGTVHKVGDSSGWTMANVNYEAWASSKTFQVRRLFGFRIQQWFSRCHWSHYHNNFELCQPSKPLAIYQTGSDRISLTKPGYQNFMWCSWSLQNRTKTSNPRLSGLNGSCCASSS